MSALAVARSSFTTSLARYRRSWGLWLLLLAAPVSARYWIADKDAASAAVVINGHAPILTSAVIGLSLGVIIADVLRPLLFIYLRSNTTRRQPWQIEETTAASRIAIGLGRFGADVAVFGAMLVAMTFAGWLLAWVVEPTDGVRPLAIALSLWLIAAPTLIGVAALRSWFDAWRITRGPLGEVFFVFFLVVSMVASVASAPPPHNFARAMTDFSGWARPLGYTLTLDKETHIAVGKVSARAGRIPVDVERGLASDGYVASRLVWVGLAVALVALAGLVYRPHRPGRRFSLVGWLAERLAAGPPPPVQADAPPAGHARRPWLGVLAAEFRLIGHGRVWWLLALAVAALGGFGGFAEAGAPAMALLLIFAASAHAGRSEQAGWLGLTRTMQFSPMSRRLAFIVSGTAWAVLMALPAILRAALAGSVEPLALAAAVGAVIATLAIVLGAWARSSAAPRLILLIAWYAWITAPK